MIRINLLPWREEARRRRRRRFYRQLGLVAVAALAVVAAVSLTHDARLDGQKARDQALRSQIASLDAQLARAAELKQQLEMHHRRVAISERLQAERLATAHLFERLAHALPNGARLTRLNMLDGQLIVAGTASDSQHISDFLAELQRADGPMEADLHSVLAGDDGYEFRMQARVAP